VAFGERESVHWRGFLGIDPHRTGIYPEVFVPQELVNDGLLLDARNLRFSNGRAYWYRNQLKIKTPEKVCGCLEALNIRTPANNGAVRSGGVVTITTGAEHGLVTGNRVVISEVDDSSFDGEHIVTSTPASNTFTYTQAGPDAVSGSGIVRPTWPTAFVEYYSADHNQLLCFSDEGKMYYMETDWSEMPTQWEYGYELFAANTWTEVSDDLPAEPYWAFANWQDRLIIASGRSLGFNNGMPTKMWNGSTLTDIGLATPTTAPTATADSSSPASLPVGRYSYYVVYGNENFESMPGPIVDVDIEESTATGTFSQTTWNARPTSYDWVSVGYTAYTFIRDEDWEEVESAGSVYVPNSGDAETDAVTAFRNLAELINNGGNYAVPGVGQSLSMPANQYVTAAVNYVPGVSLSLTFTAKEAGSSGNSIPLSCLETRLDVSGSTLSGGISYIHVDLSNIPTGPTGVTYRKLYRAYSEVIEPGVRGSEFLYLATINDNSTTTFVDNTPEEELGEPIAFDHAIPPRGDLLVFHRDRLYMAGVCYAGESYKSVANISNASWSSGTATITTATDHGFNIGETVVVAGVTESAYNGSFTVLSVPSSKSFTYALATSVGSSSGGTATGGVYTDNLQNVLFYSQPSECFYWPITNQITVGDSAPIVGLVTWNDQLLILKTNSAFLLTGYWEEDFRLTEIPGITGAIGPHVAASPYGVVYAGHQGWMLWNGEQATTLVDYTEDTNFTGEPTAFKPPRIPEGGQAKFPAICYHAGRFHFWGGGYTFSWRPDTNSWEISRRQTSQVGYRPHEYSVYQSHILTFMRWGSLTTGTYYLTVLDDQYKPPNDIGVDTSRFNDSEGSELDETRGEVRIELPPVVAPPGEIINPMEFYLYGQWTVPEDDYYDLYLYIYDDDAGSWSQVGKVTQNKRLGIPGGYAGYRIRLMLYGRRVPFFVMQACGLVYQRHLQRGVG